MKQPAKNIFKCINCILDEAKNIFKCINCILDEEILFLQLKFIVGVIYIF